MTESPGRRDFRNGAVLAAALFMAGAGTAGAHVTMILDPLDAAAGRPIVALDRVWVAILGSDHVDVRQIARRTLRLGTRDTEGARPRGFLRGDVNDDGFRDLLVSFDVGATGLRVAEDYAAVLTGGFRDGRTIFRAQDTSAQAATPISFCYVVSGESETGMRCEFTQSQAPLDLAALIAEINGVLAPFGGTVTETSSVVVEAYGGHGHDGREVVPCVNIGIGGGRGYGSTLYTVADLEALAAAGLYLYVAEDGPGYEDGGSASVAIGKPITSVGDIGDPSAEQLLTIGGGGGGGGKSTSQGGNCKGGWDGGAGGMAQPELLRDASAAGQDGATGNKGQGGNQDGAGTGGAATGGSREGKAGTDGIGGYGNEGLARWAGADVHSIVWDHGQGGIGGKTDNAGAGGGGFGGGGGGRGGEHKGGGGGGGSWARQHSVIAPVFRAELALGPSHDPGWPAIVVTFEVQTDEAPGGE